MGTVFEEIDARLAGWIAEQSMFFVGSAPLSADGRVNISPKGPMDSFAVLGPHRVAYLDVVGSGAETIAHLRENGRIVVMFCAFQGPPRIVRLHGRGRYVQADDAGFEALVEECGFRQPSVPQSRRAVIEVEVERVADSCGYGVPVMSYEGEREHQALSSAKRVRVKGPDAYADYQRQKNAESIDGLPAVDV